MSPHFGSRKFIGIKKSLLAIHTVYIGLWSIYFLLRMASIDGVWPVSLIDTFLHLLLIPFWASCLSMLILKEWKHAAASGLGIICFLTLWVPMFSPRPAGECTKTCFSVMSYNMGADLASAEELVRVFDETPVDIIGLQEISEDFSAIMKSQLSESYPYQLDYQNGVDLGLLSRYPIVEAKLVEGTSEHLWSYISAKVDVQGRIVTIIIYRTHPPRLGNYVGRFGYHTWRGGESIARRLPLEEPLIVLSDLNTTDQTKDYRYVSQTGLKDAFREAGWGLGATFPARPDGWHNLPVPPLMRIDYIWVSIDFKVLYSSTGASIGSDHRPVIAELSW